MGRGQGNDREAVKIKMVEVVMELKLNKYLDMLFEEAPNTRQALELKEELLANTKERYQDLIAEGFTPEEAYKNAIASLGNVSELFVDLKADNKLEQEDQEDNRKKRAFIQAISVSLYIVGVAVLILFSMIDDIFNYQGSFEWGQVGLVLLLLIYSVAVCMQVYASKAYPKYQKKEDTIVEEFREWKSGKSRQKELRYMINTIIWLLTVILYFIFSFLTYRWDISWILFLVGACATVIVKLIFSLSNSES